MSALFVLLLTQGELVVSAVKLDRFSSWMAR